MVYVKGEASPVCLVLPHGNLLFPDISRAIELLDKLQRTGEVPPQKLQALQRVLQSEFCNAVREVSIELCDRFNHVCLCQVALVRSFASFAVQV